MKRRFQSSIACAALGFASVAIGGCSGYRDPSIKVSGAAIAERTEEAMTIRFTMDLNNPNQESIKLLQVEYDLVVNGKVVYSGMRAAEATLASNDQRQVQIPAVVRFDALSWTPQDLPESSDYSLSGTLQYVTPGEIAQILFDTGVRKPRASFRQTGTLAIGG